MKKELEQYFGCEVKIAEYKNKLPLPIFMTMSISFTRSQNCRSCCECRIRQ